VLAQVRARDLGRVGREVRTHPGTLLAALAIVVYVASNPLRSNLYDHFVWQADAFLHGRAAIPWPVFTGPHPNVQFRDILPLADQPGYGLMPYPPLPALLLVPFVAVWGLGTNASLFAAVLGGLNVWLAWRVAARLTPDRAASLVATCFYAFGTVAWYAAAIGSTWFLAHVVASTCLFLAIALALDADPASTSGARAPGAFRQVLAGLAFGLGALARLTTVLGAPFFAFVGGGRSWLQRALLAGAGTAVPLALLLAYNLVTTGHVFHPAYEFAYRTEIPPRAGLVHRDWAIEDPRYIPQSLRIMLGSLPVIRPQCGPSLLDPACPIIAPDPLGMSLLLTSPGWLLAAGSVLGRARPWAEPPPGLRRRLVAGATVATLLIAVVNLAHFSQGWVQFGYRFSNDFAPFLFVLATLGIARRGVGRLTVGLVALSVLINAWGVYWGVAFRW
jgi:hypothetical protein